MSERLVEERIKWELEKAFWAEQEKKEEACYDQIYEEYIKTEEGKKRLERLRKYEGEKREKNGNKNTER